MMRSRARIENFPITISGSYQVVVETYCGDELCGTCGLSLQVDCREQVPVGDGTSGLHSIILNPANDTTVFSFYGPTGIYELQTLSGIDLLGCKDIVTNEATIDLSRFQMGFTRSWLIVTSATNL